MISFLETQISAFPTRKIPRITQGLTKDLQLEKWEKAVDQKSEPRFRQFKSTM